MIDKDPQEQREKSAHDNLLDALNLGVNVLADEGEEETVVNLLAPANGQGFAYAIDDGGVALVIVADGISRTEVMSSHQAMILGEQLINAADVDDENW